MIPRPERVLLSGTVERVTYHNEDTGFAVLRVQTRGARDLVTVVGQMAAVSPGESIQAGGAWVLDRQHGRQFRASWLKTAAPTSIEGILRYLSSGLVKGIGPHFASRLVEAFGDTVFDVIEREPSRLRDVAGIGPLRASRITEGWSTQRAVRDIMVFLHTHGVGTSRATRIFKTYGIDAIAVMTENPYRLASDVRGIGFISADRIAAKLGIEKTALVRARAGVSYALSTALDEGHCGLPEGQLVEKAGRLLEIDDELVQRALELEVTAGTVVRDTVSGGPCVFLAGLHAAERSIATHLRRLVTGAPPWPPIRVDKALPWISGRLGLTLAPAQQEAFTHALTSKALVITGGPGVGKTTLLEAILRVLTAKGVRPLACAPTGRAAKRLSEATGLEARTIHRLLEINPRDGRFRRNEHHSLDGDLLLVDEMSMVDVLLMSALLRAVPPHAAILLVGDVDQLPSVGPGQVLADIIASRAIRVTALTEVFRQAAESRIVSNAHRVNRGEMPELQAGAELRDFYVLRVTHPDEAAEKVVGLVQHRIPERFGLDPIRDVQVLCPMNRGSVGARSMNLALQRVLNPSSPSRVERFGYTFGVGDKVMQVENDYDKEVYNGDIGFVRSIDVDAGEVIVHFDGRPVTYELGELDRLVLAYACTIHKAQGSEYPAIVIPLTTQHYPMLQRNLLYTGMTRGRRLVVLVAQPKALALAVRNVEGRRRWSKLREWLE